MRDFPAAAYPLPPMLLSCRLRPAAALLAVGLAVLGGAAAPAAAQTPLFGDSFETGDTASWSETEPPIIPNCNCYFSSDCPGGTFCYWGPGGPFTEDVCNWRSPKPQGIPGNGCTEDAAAAGPICDGFCTPSNLGSRFGHEDPWLLAQGVQLWGDALLLPSQAGGGPVDPALAAQALALDFDSPLTAPLLGRQVADVLVLTVGLEVYDYFCHYENGPETPEFWVDLSDDGCALSAGRLVLEAVIQEILDPGAGEAVIGRIPLYCSDWQGRFGPRCARGEASLDCLTQRVRETAQYLTTPRWGLAAPAATTALPTP